MADAFAKLEGVKELRRELKKLPQLFLDAMAEELTGIGDDVTKAGAAAAPVKTGEIRDSVLVKKKLRQQKTSFTYLGILNSTHAAAVHEGIFGFTKKTLGSFKWWERIFDSREGSMTDKVVRRCQRLTGGGGDE